MAGSGLDKKFQDKVKSVASHAEETYKGQTNEGQVAWDTLDDNGPDQPGPERFLKTFRDEFNRQALGQQYIDLNSSVSTNQDDIASRVSQVGIVRLQYDWLMQLERDFLLRKRTRVRAEAHAAAVREMMADGNGPVLNGILRVARQTLAKAGEEE